MLIMVISKPAEVTNGNIQDFRQSLLTMPLNFVSFTLQLRFDATLFYITVIWHNVGGKQTFTADDWSWQDIWKMIYNISDFLFL